MTAALCGALESACAAPCFTTHASLTARPLWKAGANGWRVAGRCGVWLTNFVMKKANKEA